MEDKEYENDVDYEEETVDNVTDDEKTDDYLNEILTESQEFKEEPEEFEKNEEGVTGDEWKDEEKEKLLKEIKEENKRNAERRIRNKNKQTPADEGKDTSEQEKRLEDDDLDAAELEQFRERTKQLEERMNIAAPVMDYLVQNRIGQNELQLGVDFVNHWRTDKIGCAKKILTALEQSGIDIGQILAHDDTQLRVMQGIDQRMKPIMQQRAEERRMIENRNKLDTFLDKHPDAWNHLEEITEVMQRTGNSDLNDAYFRLRRTYKNKNIPWFDEDEMSQEVYEEDEQPQVSSPRAEEYGSYQPQNFSSIGDLVTHETRKLFRR